jgi:uncharacterized protein YkwD
MLKKLFTILLLVSGWQATASADLLNAVNTARVQCQPSAQQLRSSKPLSNAAKYVAEGMKPPDAAHKAGYAMTQLASLRLAGFKSERDMQAELLRKYCKAISDLDSRDVGYFQRGDKLWILIGAARGDPGDLGAAANKALVLVNKARAQARRCGSEKFKATSPLALNSLLTQAALAHSQDMARQRYLEHKGRDGSMPADRITRTGYQWKLVGENIAAGEGSVEMAVDDWLSSPHHCANIMNAQFKEMGLAFAINKRASSKRI